MFEFAGLAAIAGGYVASVWRAVLERRALSALLQMDDRLLRDIGLTRADVVDSFTTRMGTFTTRMGTFDRPVDDAPRQSKAPPASLAA